MSMFLRNPVDTSEHADSYYASSANFPEAYPHLEGELDVDVAIVGGGFSGVSGRVNVCFLVVFLDQFLAL